MSKTFLQFLTVLALALLVSAGLAAQHKENPMDQQVFYQTVKVNGLSIFYRGGPQDAPALLLLHGLPSSSRMFHPLLARLADKYHPIAPDYLGFGHSDGSNPKQFHSTLPPDGITPPNENPIPKYDRHATGVRASYR